MEFYQQGDVLLVPSKIPPQAKKVDDPVLAHGEATGHAHRLHGDGFTVFEHPTTKKKHLRIVRTTALRHEEHKEIALPPGEYEVGGVREYDHFDEEARQVVD
jgi:hypothetical protein